MQINVRSLSLADKIRRLEDGGWWVANEAVIKSDKEQRGRT